jgi:DNA repair exonuclease SbcCD ATPase subunit
MESLKQLENQTALDNYIESETLLEQYNNYQNNIKVREELAQLDKQIAFYNNYQELRRQLTLLSSQQAAYNARQTLINDIAQAEIKLTSLKTDHNEKLNSNENASKFLQYTKELSMLESNKQKQSERNALKQQLHALENERVEKDKDIKTFTKSLATLDAHATLQAEIDSLEKQITYMDIYQKHTSLKHGISNILLNRCLSRFEAEINGILEQITDFAIKFDINSEYFLNIQAGKETIPATQASGFQKFIITLAIRLIQAKSHPVLPSFVILDEGFGCMDSEHLQNTIEFLQTFNPAGLDWLVFVSHIPAMSGISTAVLAVNKDEISKISSIKF